MEDNSGVSVASLFDCRRGLAVLRSAEGLGGKEGLQA